MTLDEARILWNVTSGLEAVIEQFGFEDGEPISDTVEWFQLLAIEARALLSDRGITREKLEAEFEAIA